jgi:pyruvate/2-oxoglutarate/acetoin dehydrogenase E1 component
LERTLTYGQAIQEAIQQEMTRDPSVFVLGMGVDDPTLLYGTSKGLVDEFGPDRVLDTPVAEDAMTGMAIGAALGGMRPIHVHIRMDFMLLAMNQLINMAAKMKYMYGSAVTVPIVVRGIIGRSWGQGPQHSQGLHSLFMHIPGLKIVAPVTPYDAKGCLIESIRDNNPVIFIEHRMLHGLESHVPEESFTVPFGTARVLETGSDVTIIGISHVVVECLRAREYLKEAGISAAVIVPVSLSPLDMDPIVASVRKTGRLLVVDNAWTNCGAGAEIITRVIETLQGEMKIQVGRMGFEPVTCPTTRELEDLFYPNGTTIASSAHAMCGGDKLWTPQGETAAEITAFRGPF